MRWLLLLAPLCACTPDSPDPPEPEPFPGDPAAAGPWSVSLEDFEVATADDVVDVTLQLPQGEGPWTGPAPVVLLMPGFSSRHTAWEDWGEHLASWGFAVAAFTFSANSFSDPADHERDAEEARAVLDWLDDFDVDHDRVAAAGHSKGGKIAFFAAALDERIDAVVGYDPVDAGGAPCFIDPDACHQWSVAPGSYEGDAGMMDGLAIPSLIFAAPAGLANPAEHHASLFFDGAPSPSTYALHPEALHAWWPGEDDVADVDLPMSVAFLASHLRGANGTDPWLHGAWLQEHIDDGDVEVESK